MENATMGAKEVIGLIPAAGRAVRISPLPCSKEIFPIGYEQGGDASPGRPRAICEYLLAPMRKCGVKKAYLSLRSDKWDIPSYLGSGRTLDMQLAYVITDQPHGVPYTLDSAFPFVQGRQIVFGFPDTVFQPEDAFVRLMDKQRSTAADMVLGLFPATDPGKVDMVVLDDDRRIVDLHIKPPRTDLTFTWIIAVWEDRFTRFLHDFVRDHQEALTRRGGDGLQAEYAEIHLGNVIQAALRDGLNVENVLFEQGSFIDIGTIEDMMRATRESLQNTTDYPLRRGDQ